jgi:hypothetical protein
VRLYLGKKRRLTFIECNNEFNSMIDIGKIADLVLLMIDASLGFEMVGRSRLVLESPISSLLSRKHLSF